MMDSHGKRGYLGFKGIGNSRYSPRNATSYKDAAMMNMEGLLKMPPVNRTC